ncbi:GAF domain-containing protein [Cohnella pontilimi]|uniref:GAF domain-containing protein n=1 Tax=Cohnella pontilimi TaxID=2564100 RepID=A0A4U0F913_9BACL|nr:GAF domain-containing protein [Cohnella pontilimi]TJY41131.1 GAF domain-containing protein [Cohnella pontilimi]
MDGGKSAFWLEVMEQLRTEIDCDFCCVGLVEGESRSLHWKAASGNEGERYSSISDRPGRGLTGTVVKVGRAMPVNFADLIMSRTLHEYPIMTAERLRSAYAVPLTEGASVMGVLLAGDRWKRVYRPEERNCIKLAAERISRKFAENSSEAASS